MSAEGSRRRRRLHGPTLGRLAFVTALATVAFTLAASAASARTVRVVSQTKSGPNIYSTIQGAVNAANPGDWVLVETGKYNESVLVQTEGLKIRGMDRNGVILDGLNEPGPEGRNGI